MVTIICPIYNEEKFIAKCIESILGQDFPQDELEILLIDGMSSDNTRQIISQYTAQHSNIQLIDNPNRTVPYALNIGIREAKGDVIIRLDAHCKYPENYVSTLSQKLTELNADNVGGVWKTLPANDSCIALAIAIASSHPFGVGDSKHKTGATQIIEVDTVPFGCYRREVFDRIGLFDTDLTRNQDDEFNARLIKNGGKIFLIPDIVIEYTARETISKMRKMYYQYGLFKPLVNKKLGKAATTRQFFPLMFLIGLVIGAIVSPFSKVLCAVYLLVLALYFGIGLIVGIKKALENRRFALIFLMPFVFLNVHLSYGFGYLIGIYKVLMNKDFNVKYNR